MSLPLTTLTVVRFKQKTKTVEQSLHMQIWS